MQADAIDRVIKNAIEVLESSKYQIFEISETAISERGALDRELKLVIKETAQTIEQVDKLELDLRYAKIRLSEVSRDVHRFQEEDIRIAYEMATRLQLELMIAREKEKHLRGRRDDLQKRLRNLDRTIERAESLASQMNVVLEYLSGDLSQATRILESAKNRQLLGLKIILAQEDERKRISREIHDGLAQSMANVLLRAEIAERMLLIKEYKAVKDELSELKGMVRSGLEEVRKMIFNLRPMTLDDLGLLPTLRKFILDFEEKTKIHTKFEVIGKDIRLSPSMEVAIFRLIQEAFSNVSKHAQASFLSVEMSFEPHQLKIVVQDNGKGFSVKKMESEISGGSHFGIMGMRERVELLEGKIDIHSEKKVGTKIIMTIPINTESNS